MTKNILFTIIVSFMVVGCATTTGLYDPNNQNYDPYKFSYYGSSQEATKTLKRILFDLNFTIDVDDSSSGILITKHRGLSEDERHNIPAMASVMLGVRGGNQLGTVRFLIEPNADSTFCFMTCLLVTEAIVNVNAFKNESKVEEQPIPQGHPLPMKVKTQILKNKSFKNVTPKKQENKK